MGKLVMVISGAVTAFILAITAGAVYAYRTMSVSAPGAVTVANAQQPVSPVTTSLQLAAAPATPTTALNVSAQDAAALAAKFMNRTDLYSVQLADFQGMQAYKVTFVTGDAAFVSMHGQMLSFQPVPTPAPATTFGGGPSHHGGGGGGGGASSGTAAGGGGGGGWENEGGGDDGGG